MNHYNAISAINTENIVGNIGPYSHAVAYSHYNHISAQLPIDPKTGAIVAGGVKEQAKQSFENIKAIVTGMDHVMSDIVKVTVYVTDIKAIDHVDEIYKSYFPTYVPAQTKVAVANLPMGALVQIEALVSHGEGTIPNAPQSGDLIKLTNNTPNAPVTSLSSQSVAFSHYNNLSAQLPLDPKSGRLIVGDIKEQTRQSLTNVKEILKSIEVPFDDIVKVNLFIKDLADIEVVDEVYRTFFPDSGIARAVAYMPARTIVEASALPMDALIQIEVVVSHGDGTPPQLIEDRHGIIIEANNTKDAPISSLSTQTVAFSHYNHIGAQLPLDLETGDLVAGGIKAQTEKCLTQIKTIVESVDHLLEDVVKINIHLKNIDDIDEVDEVYKTFFPDGIPARTTIGVSKLSKDALIQMDAVVSNAEGTPPVVQ